MDEFREEYMVTFLRNQAQLFDEPVAETLEEAEAFLEDCMAVVVDSLSEAKAYFEENGAEGMTEDRIYRLLPGKSGDGGAHIEDRRKKNARVCIRNKVRTDGRRIETSGRSEFMPWPMAGADKACARSCGFF